MAQFTQNQPAFMMLPAATGFAAAALAGFAAASSSSLLDSSLLEVSVLGFAFLADGPSPASALVGGAFRFLDSGDLGREIKDLVSPR